MLSEGGSKMLVSQILIAFSQIDPKMMKGKTGKLKTKQFSLYLFSSFLYHVS